MTESIRSVVTVTEATELRVTSNPALEHHGNWRCDLYFPGTCSSARSARGLLR